MTGRRAWPAALVAGIAAAPMAAYSLLLYQTDPFWSGTYSAQNLMPAPAPWSLPFDFGLVLLVAPLSWPIVRHWPAERRRLILLWICLGLLWMYAPVAYQRRFAFGVQPALAVLAGIGLVEIFDLDPTVPTKLSNSSTRGLVETGDGVMIGGFIIKGPDNDKVVIRAIGPSLANPPINITNALQNPTLSLFDVNGTKIAFNDDWRSDQQADIIATGLQPSNDLESAIVITLTPGNYTAIVSGVNDTTGVALVEVYGLN